MSNAAVYLGSGGAVTVAAAGALTGNGTVSTPLAVAVDGVTVTIVGDTLTAPGGGGGTIGGTVGASDNTVPRSDGTGGSTLQASALVISDAAAASGLKSVALTGSSSGSTVVQPAAAASGTLTLPATTDTLVGKATTDTLTNKTLTAPTLTAPVLGTPASGTLTNCVGLPAAAVVAGDLVMTSFSNGNATPGAPSNSQFWVVCTGTSPSRICQLMVQDGGSANFTVGVSGTYTYLKTVANGGEVQSSSGYDIGFFSDTGCSLKLNWEVEIWSASSGTVTYWVQVPTLSHTSDTVFYLCYDSTTVTTDQSNATGSWDANYKLVYHWPNGSSLTSSDSTSNANTGVITAATATAGQLGGAASFNGTSAKILSTNEVIDPSASDFTASWWFNGTSFSTAPNFISQANGTGTGRTWLSLSSSGVASTNLGNVGAGGTFVFTASTSTTTYLVLTKSGTTIHLYVNGVVDATTVTATTEAATGVLNVGISKGGAALYNGWMDEVRVSNTLRSTSWITADYNNQSSPSTFYTVGTEN